MQRIAFAALNSEGFFLVLFSSSGVEGLYFAYWMLVLVSLQP